MKGWQSSWTILPTFCYKIENLQNIPESEILAKVDAVGLYPSISQETGLNALREAVYNMENKHIYHSWKRRSLF